MTDEPTISVMLTVNEADTLIRAWNGDHDAIASDEVSRAIEAIADALDQHDSGAIAGTGRRDA